MDVLRVVVLVPVCLVLGTTAAVLRLYAKAWRVLPREEARLAPAHVALVSAGVLLLTLGLAWALLTGLRSPDGLDAPVMIRLCMYGVGSTAILAALWIIGGVQRRKIRFVKKVVVQVEDGGQHGG